MKRSEIDLLPFETKREVLDQIARGIGSRDIEKWLEAHGHEIDHTSIYRYSHQPRIHEIAYDYFPGLYAGVRDVASAVRRALLYSESHEVHVERKLLDRYSEMTAFYANVGDNPKTKVFRVDKREFNLFRRFCARHPMASASNIVRALAVIGSNLP